MPAPEIIHQLVAKFEANREGINSCQLSCEIGVTQKTAWFMLGRLCEVATSMRNAEAPLRTTVEANETHFSDKEKNKHANKRNNSGRGVFGKTPIVGATERKGNVKAIKSDNSNKGTLHSFITKNVVKGSSLYTDEHPSYNGLTENNHESGNHITGEYVRGVIHMNGMESFWAMFKRGHYGVFHLFTVKHLCRYVAEFEMRWNSRIAKQTHRIVSMLGSVLGLRHSYENLIK